MVKGRGYLSYVVRLWEVQGDQRAEWRASVQELATGERRAFASVDALCAYLHGQTQACTAQGEAAANDNHPDSDLDATERR